MNWIQPPLDPAVTRFISSKASSPFSDSQRKPVAGSKARPKPLRWPYEKTLWMFAVTFVSPYVLLAGVTTSAA